MIIEINGRIVTQALDHKKPKFWTKTGLQALGRLVKQSREKTKLSQRGISALIEERTGHYVSDTSLGDIERATKEPKWNTLAAIAAAEFCFKSDGSPYTVDDFSNIASESYSKKICDGIHRSDIVYPEYKKTDTGVMTSGFWDERTCLRVQALIKESLRRQGLSGQPGAAAEQAGIDPASFDRAALRAFCSGSVDRMQGTRVTPGLVDAIAAICYEVIGGWNADHTPRSLGSSTYRDRSQQFLNDLLNHERQKV